MMERMVLSVFSVVSIWATIVVDAFIPNLRSFNCRESEPLNESLFEITHSVSQTEDGSWKLLYDISWEPPNDTTEQVYFAEFSVETRNATLEPWNFTSCTEGLEYADAFSTDKYRVRLPDSSSIYTTELQAIRMAATLTYSPEFVQEVPFTHRGVFQVAFAITSQGKTLPVSPSTNVFLETPDCYNATQDAEFCASQSVVRCGQPHSVMLIAATKDADTIRLEFEWMRPVQINEMAMMNHYNVQIHSVDGDLITMETISDDKEVVTWVTTDYGELGGFEDNQQYILTVVPYVRYNEEEELPPLPGRLITFPFILELTDVTTEKSGEVPASNLPPSPNIISILAIVLAGVGLIIFICVVLAVRKKKRRSLGPRSPRENVPLDEKYSKKAEEEIREVDEVLRDKEISPEQVTIESKLGEGEFGIVHKGHLRITEKGKPRDIVVAVKTTKVGAYYDAKEDLLNEMKLIAELGVHPNILHLIACCSAMEPFYIITEFMQYGDLLGFLRKCRETGDENRDPIYNVGEKEQLVISRDIAKGMAHIQERRFYHGDLAARNVLVGEQLSVKISDFGLADDIYTRGYKRREVEQKIPIKWCSLETILNGICSSQGDVWSFGVLLYEVFTLGGTPYPGVAPRFLVTQLKQGYRMEQPKGCPDDAYKLMRRCWEIDPQDRPRFQFISEDLAEMLMKRTDYVEFEAAEDFDPDDTERYVRDPTAAIDVNNLAPIDDRDNEVDLEQLHSALNTDKELL